MSASPFPSITGRCRAVVIAGLFIAALATADAAAAPTTSALCTGTISIDITPGFTLAPGSGSATSGGETGTMTCLGTFDGHRLTGPGSFGAVETYTTGAACLTDRSSGQVSVTLPTTGGPVTIVGTLRARRVALVEFIEIAFPDSHFGGVAVDVPTRGTCLLAPLTRALVSVTGLLL